MFKQLMLLPLIFSSYVMAYQLITDEEATKQQTQIAAYQVEEAKQDYFTAHERCVKQAEQNVLAVNDFKGIQLTGKELKATILYFSAKNFKTCMGDNADKYLMAINVARYFDVAEYSKKDDPSSDKSLARAAALAIDEVKYYPDYLAIDKSKREALEKIANLNKVFNLMASFKALKAIEK